MAYDQQPQAGQGGEGEAHLGIVNQRKRQVTDGFLGSLFTKRLHKSGARSKRIATLGQIMAHVGAIVC